jgi:hypothetical protein
MGKLKWIRLLAIAVLVLLCTLPVAWAAPAPDSTTTYTITLRQDGSALWTVDYRTPIATGDDLNSFENYSEELKSVYLPQLVDLMQRSAAQAAAGTSRLMAVGNFTGDAVIQTSPTGRYGVVTYSFSWTNFSTTDGGLSAGDAFAGGLYLDKDSTLVVRYPPGFTVTSADPIPDQQSAEGLVWYGLRSFGPGEPRIVLAGPAFPVLPVLFISVAIVIAAAGYVVYRKRRQKGDGEELPDEPEDQPASLSEAEMVSLEERITRLLRANGGEQFQSEIVRVLGMPKSTVSSTLNDLHRRGIIQKVRKGRENLIRLIAESTSSS